METALAGLENVFSYASWLVPTFSMVSLLGTVAFINPHPSSTNPPPTAIDIKFRATPAMSHEPAHFRTEVGWFAKSRD